MILIAPLDFFMALRIINKSLDSGNFNPHILPLTSFSYPREQVFLPGEKVVYALY